METDSLIEKLSIISVDDMRIYSYVIPRDYGFAPNPFYGYCTLATCKPDIRRLASIGDVVVGTGGVPNVNKIVYFMQVSEIVSFDQYWDDTRFLKKRPRFNAGVKQAYGDNIYHRGDDGGWIQERSHHTHEDGMMIQDNIDTDTGKTENVLIGEVFSYWGDKAIEIPERYRDLVKTGPYHKCKFEDDFVEEVRGWLMKQDRGVIGDPSHW
ncbi:hypothetical protein RSO41_15510 [Halomonas sp. I1]|uniref:Nmad2 family putative nucleotide modification protein n=1 Tax=Halomonas sp. I1 TaxID=393536 RepID=UPI0028DDDAAC|nr:hypothetical protein [Halomonas sp. I1]MDT8896056.1 hypothetical protein [Halomonas sp. I1]